MHWRNTFVAKLRLYYTGLAKGTGNVGTIQSNFETLGEQIEAHWDELNEIDQKEVTKARSLTGELLEQHLEAIAAQAAKKAEDDRAAMNDHARLDAQAGDGTVLPDYDPTTGEIIGEAA